MMELKPFQKEHLHSVIECSNLTLGYNFLNQEYLNKYIGSEKNIGLIILVKNQVVGFSLIDILTPIELKDIVLKDKDWFYNLLKSYKKIALRKQTVIVPQFDNKGIGSLLVEQATNELNLNTDIQLSTVWIKPEGNGMTRLLKKNGFELSKTITNYWKEDSILKKYDCPICGTPPCKCSTEVYIKKKH